MDYSGVFFHVLVAESTHGWEAIWKASLEPQPASVVPAIAPLQCTPRRLVGVPIERPALLFRHFFDLSFAFLRFFLVQNSQHVYSAIWLNVLEVWCWSYLETCTFYFHEGLVSNNHARWLSCFQLRVGYFFLLVALAQLSLGGTDRWEWHCSLLLSGLASSFCQYLHAGKAGSQHSPVQCNPRNFPFRPVAACGWSVHPSLDEDWSGTAICLLFLRSICNSGSVGMTWDASMIGCYSFSVNDASCSDCLSFFGQSWSSMTPLRSLSWRRVNRLSNHLKCLFFIWFYLEIVNMEIAPSSVGKEAPLLLKLIQSTKFWLWKLPGSIGACASLFAYSLVDLRIFHNSTQCFRSPSYKNHPHPGMAVSALDRHVDILQ